MSRPVSIVIPSWNGREILERNLPRVRAALESCGDGETIVVDDGSGDGTAAWLRSAHPWARCLALAANGGFGAAVNAGVAEARHPLVLLLNNDMAPEPGFLAPLAAAFATRSDLFAAVPVIVNRTFGGDEAATACRFRFGLMETVFPERAAAPAGPPGPREILFACGGAAVVDRAAFRALGGFDPLFAPFYWEDVDLSWRARKRGLAIVQVAGSLVHHEHGATIGARFATARVRAVYERNRLLFQWKDITSPGMTARHLLWLPLRLARAAAGRPEFLRGFAAAVPRLAAARRGRRVERREGRVPDAAIASRFAGPAMRLPRALRAFQRDGGETRLRLDYPLGPSSLVFDLGGYRGDWAAAMRARHGCRVQVFEPVPDYARALAARFAGDPAVEIHPFGLGAATGTSRLVLDGDRSSVFGHDGEAVAIGLVRAADFLKERGVGMIDVVKINIEGGEYDLLDHLLDAGLATRFRHIQVQFHAFVPGARRRARAIRSRLRRTHDLAWSYPFVWESWRLRAGAQAS